METVPVRQTVSKRDIDGGKTYLSVMRSNLETLSCALDSEGK